MTQTDGEWLGCNAKGQTIGRCQSLEINLEVIRELRLHRSNVK
ncbi:MAG: hypothetical protein AAF327_21405 [Cyanobacteria bacterium P01_A01_bin.37]